MRVAVKIAVSSALVASLSAMLGVSAAASPPIRAHQHFVGVVNGRSASAAASPVVYTVCAGPIWAGRSGPLAGGQTVAVARAAKHGGYTGLFSQVYAWIVEDSSADAPNRSASPGTEETWPFRPLSECRATERGGSSSVPARTSRRARPAGSPHWSRCASRTSPTDPNRRFWWSSLVPLVWTWTSRAAQRALMAAS